MKCLIPSLAFLALLASRADAQARTLAIAPGETVQVVKRSMFDRGPAARPPGRRVDYLYETRIASSDSAARHQQADRAAQLLGAEASELGVRLLSIGVCDNQACSEGKQPPALWFLYERAGGTWRRVTLR